MRSTNPGTCRSSDGEPTPIRHHGDARQASGIGRRCPVPLPAVEVVHDRSRVRSDVALTDCPDVGRTYERDVHQLVVGTIGRRRSPHAGPSSSIPTKEQAQLLTESGRAPTAQASPLSATATAPSVLPLLLGTLTDFHLTPFQRRTRLPVPSTVLV